MTTQERNRIREISVRTADPIGLANLLEQLLGFTKLKCEEEVTTAILTDGYLQIGITNLRPGEEGSAVTLDHIGVEVDDLAETMSEFRGREWREPANSTPATRFVNGPDGWQIEVRERGWGWDDVIRAKTDLYELVPETDDRPIAVDLPAVTSATAVDGFVRVGDVGSVPEAGARVNVDGVPVFVVPFEGELHAVADACPHMPRFGRVSEGQRHGNVLECPIHRSRFDLHDGHVLEPPSRKGLQCFAVEIRDGDVWVGSPTS